MEIVDVMIPVRRPDERLAKCVCRLLEQSWPVRSITLVLSIGSGGAAGEQKEAWAVDVESRFAGFPSVHIQQIDGAHFDHGGTRHEWAAASDADILLFMVQDAVPADCRLVENLAEALQDPQNAVAYARHLPDGCCDAIETYTRYFIYPPRDRKKTWTDVEKSGIDGCFTSNVCAAYRRDWYEKTGGFERRIPLSEDSVFAARAMKLGAAVIYCARAGVIHAHRFSYDMQWKRNFDIGVVHNKYRNIFEGPVTERRGAKLIAQTAGYLIRHGEPGLIPRLICLGAVKAGAYTAGRHYDILPAALVKKWTLDKGYWEET